MEKYKFSGLGVAMVTPFDANKNVDYKGLERLTNHLINKGADYLVVQGTTGESAVLNEEEKQKVLDFVIEINNKRLPVVLGVGGNNTQAVCDKLKKGVSAGVDGILSVSPYYSKPIQEGIYQHYKAIANSTELPIILYNVPGRTSSNMLPETTLRLAVDFKNIVAIKEASGDLEQVMTIIQGNKRADFLVISGDDALTMPMIASGANGVISVVGNAFPQEFSSMVHASLKGDFATAKPLHYQLFKIIQALFEEGNPGGVKEVLKFLNICGNDMRLPLVNVSDATSRKLYTLIAEDDLFVNNSLVG
jgi:4-hydroxy-tetrahydrodipicolinate synthase